MGPKPKAYDLTYCADESKWLQELWEIIISRKAVGECACRDNTEPGVMVDCRLCSKGFGQEGLGAGEFTVNLGLLMVIGS